MSDAERYEKKQFAAILYQKYKNRTGPVNPGSKIKPKGNPNCLSGYTFLITGTLDSMEREEATNLIIQHGGLVVKSISKKLSYIVIGVDAGPAKMARAEELNIKQLTEDNLLELIKIKSSSDQSSTKGDDILIKRPPLIPSIKNVNILTEKVANSAIPSIQKKIINASKVDLANTITNYKDNLNLAWVDKYKPITFKQIIGQQGHSSNLAKLVNWLDMWYVNEKNKKKVKLNPWAKINDGSSFKAVLLSGPPGVGKTTSAHLACKELKHDVVEFNASDIRSKKLLQNQVSILLSNKSLVNYANSESQKRVLIMDEVDGMAGNEDRGGIAELIQLIKATHIPIICICNDRNHPKIRYLNK